MTPEADEITDLQEDVRSFHVKFGHPAPSRPVRRLNELDEMLEFRIGLIEEECEELIEAIRERNLSKIAAEAVDVMYVVIGTLVALGLPLLPFWRDVQRANMTKVPNPAGGKPLKPEGWQGPDPALILFAVKRKDN